MSKQNRNERLELRLGPEEAGRLEELARLAKTDRSKMIRRLIDRAYRELLEIQAQAKLEEAAQLPAQLTP